MHLNRTRHYDQHIPKKGSTRGMGNQPIDSFIFTRINDKGRKSERVERVKQDDKTLSKVITHMK